MTISREELIEDYTAELNYARQMAAEGKTVVSAETAGTDTDISIDEYIDRWESGLKALKDGADPEEYNY